MDYTFDDFTLACKHNNFDLAIEIYQSIHKDININLAFGFACGYGNLEIAKWLYSLGVNINAGSYAFIYACQNGCIVSALISTPEMILHLNIHMEMDIWIWPNGYIV